MTKQLQSMQEALKLEMVTLPKCLRKKFASGLIERNDLKDSLSTVKFDGSFK